MASRKGLHEGGAKEAGQAPRPISPSPAPTSLAQIQFQAGKYTQLIDPADPAQAQRFLELSATCGGGGVALARSWNGYQPLPQFAPLFCANAGKIQIQIETEIKHK